MKIWEKISNLMNIEFDSESIYGDNDKYIKTKTNKCNFLHNSKVLKKYFL